MLSYLYLLIFALSGQVEVVCVFKTMKKTMELDMKSLTAWPVMLALSVSLFGGAPALDAKEKAKKPTTKTQNPKAKRSAVDIKKIKEKIAQLKLRDPDGMPDEPQIKIDSDGNIVAVWLVYATSGNLVKSSTYSATGMTWSTPSVISGSGLYAQDPTLLLDVDGDAVAIWLSGDPNTGVESLQASKVAVGDTTWDAPTMISTLDEIVFDNFRVDINASKEVVVIWNSYLIEENDIEIFSATRAANGTWGAPVLISQ
jgi:hypothetical protein